jgi:FtsP/CotA-like multicopper oxidase with cupredoxin domain
MSRSRLLVVLSRGLPALLTLAALPAGAQNFMVQCPASTLLHPNAPTSASGEPLYTGPKTGAVVGGVPYVGNGGTVKCQQISGGDGYMTEGDGNQTFMFSFGPLSGLQKIANGQPGTDFSDEFNQPYCNGGNYNNGQLNPYSGNCSADGAVGYVAPAAFRAANVTAVVGAFNQATCTVTPTERCGVNGFVINDPGAGYSSAPNVRFSGGTGGGASASAVIGNGSIIEIAVTTPGSGYTTPPTVTLTPSGPTSTISGTDAAAIMNTGVMNGNIPAPLIAFDEDDEFFLTLTNVGMIMRPDLFEQHTVHFHGYPNASSFYDGVPDASLAINIGASFTYYYLAPDAGTYFWHCHITPPEHLQMGMVGQLYVRPRQDRAPVGTALPTVSQQQQGDLRTACYSSGESNLRFGATGTPTADILCSVPPPAPLAAGATAPTVQAAAASAPCKGPAGQACYVYNDGDGSTYYDVDVPLQIHGFDPNFHFVGMTFNSEGFSDMKDKYFLLNGRSYPDTITAGAISTQASDGMSRPSQPMPALVTLSLSGGLNGTPQRAALRIADLDVAEYQTLASLGMPMHVVGYNAKLLRDQAGNNLYYTTNSITLGGGESLDVILDACAVRGPAPTYACTTPMPVGTYFLYTPNLDHLSNDAENFGGLMTEVVVTP